MAVILSRLFIFSVFLISLMFNTKVASCGCDVLPPKKAFCDSDFVLKVLVGDVVNTGKIAFLSRAYNICISRIYKFPVGGDVDLQQLYTPETYFCGVTMTPGKEYVIAGYVDRFEKTPRMSLFQCNFYKEWTTMNETELALLDSWQCP